MVSTNTSIEAQVIIKEAAATVREGTREGKELDLADEAADLAQALADVKLILNGAEPEVATVTPPTNGGASAAPAAGGDITIKAFNDDLGMVDYLPGACPKCNSSEVWDNRKDLPINGGDRNPKSPHFKCANKSCGHGFWPPR